MIDKGEGERGREREREGERMFTKELTLMFPMKCEIFYWLIFFKIKMKDILRFKSKVISTIIFLGFNFFYSIGSSRNAYYYHQKFFKLMKKFRSAKNANKKLLSIFFTF